MGDMAITTIRTDDINQEEGAEPVSFSVQGVDYTIDLGPTSLKEFTEAQAEWIEYATVVKPEKAAGTRTRKSGGGGGNSGGGADASAIREWAAVNGFPEVPKRGRIHVDIREAYEKAHPTA